MKTEFYQMEYEAWDEGTDDLTLEQEAAYLRLCHQMYRRRGAIPESMQTLSRLWRCHSSKAKRLLSELLNAKKAQLIRTERGIECARVLDELNRRGLIATSRSEAGRLGGKISGENRRKPLENIEPIEANASSQTNHSREEKKREENSSSSARVNEFDELQARLVRECSIGLHPVALNQDLSPIFGLQAAGCDLDLDIIPGIRTRMTKLKPTDKINSWAFFNGCVIEWRNRRLGVGLQSVKTKSAEEVRNEGLTMLRALHKRDGCIRTKPKFVSDELLAEFEKSIADQPDSDNPPFLDRRAQA